MLCDGEPDRNIYFVAGNIDPKIRKDIRQTIVQQNNAIIVASHWYF